MYTGGWLTDRWLKERKHDAAMRVGIISAIGALLFLSLAFLTPNAPWLSIAFLCPGVALAAMPTGVCYAALQMILPNQVRGVAVALFLFVLNLGGLTLGPLLPGVFNDYVFRDENMVGPSIASTVIIALVLQGLSFVLMRKYYLRDYREMHPEA
jgi:MFS family permease